MSSTAHVGPVGYTYDHLSFETADTVLKARPRQASSDWDVLGPLVREAVAAANPPTPKVAQPMMKIAYEFLVWARDDYADDPSLESFTDRKVRLFMEQRPDRGQSQYARASFGLLARIVEGQTGNRPIGHTLVRGSAITYTSDEIAALWSATFSYPTKRMRDNARRVIALGLSAGLTSIELEQLRCDQIVDDEVRLEDRTIPLLNPWASDVDRRDHEAGEFYLLPTVTRYRVPGTALRGFIRELGLTRPSPRRLRTTYLVGLMNMAIPAQTMLEVAGLKTFDGLDRYIPLLDKRTPTENAQLVREQVTAR